MEANDLIMETNDLIYVIRALYTNDSKPVYHISDCKEKILETYDKIYEDSEMKLVKIYSLTKFQFFAGIASGYTINELMAYHTPKNPRLI